MMMGEENKVEFNFEQMHLGRISEHNNEEISDYIPYEDLIVDSDFHNASDIYQINSATRDSRERS
jgi:hypothetical protein